MTIPYESLCKKIVWAAQRLDTLGLVGATLGNVSTRVPGEKRFLITPNSLPQPELTPGNIVHVDFEEEILSEGQSPSIEHTIHLKIYKQREDVGAVYHTHSPCASTLAFLGLPLPVLLEEMVVYVGGQVEVAEFAQSGPEESAQKVCLGLGTRAAVFLAGHGMVSVGHTLEKGLHVAQVVERTAQIYMIARSVGMPNELPEEITKLYTDIYEDVKGQE